MKYIISLLLITTSLLSQEYYAKIQAINTYNIKSAVSGKVTFANKDIESSIVKNELILKIDDTINKVELKQTKSKLANLKNVLKIHKQTLKSFNKVSSKSKFDKDKQRILILNTQVTLNDLQIKIASLKDMIKNKNIKIKDLYIENIYVNKGDFVNPGTLLCKALDLSKGKIEIFVSADEINNIKSKSIFIDDKASDLKISKVFKTTDSKHLSSYKVEIILSKVDSFSKLVKITLK